MSQTDTIDPSSEIRYDAAQDACFHYMTSVHTVDDAEPVVVFGPPGSGKSTIIKRFKNFYGNRVAVFSPSTTAKALLEAELGVDDVYLNDYLRHEASWNRLLASGIEVMIFEECSMMDRFTYSDIMAHANVVGIRVMLIGDPRQLGPVSSLSSRFNVHIFPTLKPHFIFYKQYRQEAGVAPRVVKAVKDLTGFDLIVTMTNAERTRKNIEAHEQRYGDDAYTDASKKFLKPHVGQVLIAYGGNPGHNDAAPKDHNRGTKYLTNGLYKILAIDDSNSKYYRFNFGNHISQKWKEVPRAVFSVDVLQPSKEWFVQNTTAKKTARVHKREMEFSYALTSHCAQGRAFDNVLYIVERVKNANSEYQFPLAESDAAASIYSGIGRGKKSITIYDPTNAIAEKNILIDLTAPLECEMAPLKSNQTVPVFPRPADEPAEQEQDEPAPVLAETRSEPEVDAEAEAQAAAKAQAKAEEDAMILAAFAEPWKPTFVPMAPKTVLSKLDRLHQAVGRARKLPDGLLPYRDMEHYFSSVLGFGPEASEMLQLARDQGVIFRDMKNFSFEYVMDDEEMAYDWAAE